MKKMVVMATIIFVGSTYAFEDLKSTENLPSTQFTPQESYGTFLDATTLEHDQYEDNNSILSHLDEYDQAITNNVTPPKVSTAEAMLKQALGALLVRYITVRETARSYIQEFRNVVMQWYHKIIN